MGELVYLFGNKGKEPEPLTVQEVYRLDVCLKALTEVLNSNGTSAQAARKTHSYQLALDLLKSGKLLSTEAPSPPCKRITDSLKRLVACLPEIAPPENFFAKTVANG